MLRLSKKKIILVTVFKKSMPEYLFKKFLSTYAKKGSLSELLKRVSKIVQLGMFIT